MLLLMACLAITALLGRTKVVGPLAIAGFLLGVLATTSVIILVQTSA
jgi:hypothetical protein